MLSLERFSVVYDIEKYWSGKIMQSRTKDVKNRQIKIFTFSGKVEKISIKPDLYRMMSWSSQIQSFLSCNPRSLIRKESLDSLVNMTIP